jgi:hypothetical protein
MRNSARYSATFHRTEVYLPFRLSISKAATTNHDQWRKRSTPARRNRWIEPWRTLGIRVAYFMSPLAATHLPAFSTT